MGAAPAAGGRRGTPVCVAGGWWWGVGQGWQALGACAPACYLALQHARCPLPHPCTAPLYRTCTARIVPQEKEKYDALISRAFSHDKLFVAALNSAFEHFLNLNPRSPEYISLFMDDKLRKGLKVGACQR